MWCACGQSECDSGHDSGSHYRQRQGTLGKGKLRSLVGGTIYANVILPGMKWKYATCTTRASDTTAAKYCTMYHTSVCVCVCFVLAYLFHCSLLSGV